MKTNPFQYARFDQPCKVAILENFTPDCSYCGIGFIDRPFSISTESMTVNIYFEDAIPKKMLTEKPLYFTIITPMINDGLDVKILEVTSTRVSTSSFNKEIDHHCRVIDANPHIVELIKSAYRRQNLASKHIIDPITASEKFKKAYHDLQETRDAFKKALSEGKFQEINKVVRYPISEGDNNMIKITPFITQCIINDPAVIVFWSDGTKTIGKCMDNDKFNPEVGLAMAISRKYYEWIGFPNPRGAFKNQLKNAEDQTAKTKEKRERKKNNSEATNETEEA